MWIENVSLENVTKGFHFDPGHNSMLIQITDPLTEPPVPGFKHFGEIHQFRFLDSEIGMGEDHLEDAMISRDQAMEIAKLLVKARDNSTNVIVHCHAGICRSGAVAECGVIIGFQDVEVHRQPNLRVKQFIIDALIELGAL